MHISDKHKRYIIITASILLLLLLIWLEVPKTFTHHKYYSDINYCEDDSDCRSNVNKYYEGPRYKQLYEDIRVFFICLQGCSSIDSPLSRVISDFYVSWLKPSFICRKNQCVTTIDINNSCKSLNEALDDYYNFQTREIKERDEIEMYFFSQYFNCDINYNFSNSHNISVLEKERIYDNYVDGDKYYKLPDLDLLIE